MSGTGHMFVCKRDALFERAERAIRECAALRCSTSDMRESRRRRPHIAVLPAFTGGADAREPAVYIVGIVFSAGGLQPLIRVLHDLPRDFPAAIAVANHMGEVSCLPELLCNQTSLRVKMAEAGDRLHAGTVYVCPPQRHLVINPDATVCLSAHVRVRHARPSADWFLKTIAGAFGHRSTAVVLSGASSDGAEGVELVERAGGAIVVQAPNTCLFGAMPAAAAQRSQGCFVKDPGEIASALTAIHDAREIHLARAEWEAPF
jgi:two-component system chemotaxis response regulator CheB